MDELDVFAHHVPNADQIERIQNVRTAYAELLSVIKSNVCDNRYRSIAITELESSAMFAIKGLVLEDNIPCRTK